MNKYDWEIKIDRHRGFSPKYYENSYSSVGEKGQANDMRDISLFDPNGIMPGRSMSAVTYGTQSGAVTTLIKGMTQNAESITNAYAVGGNKFYLLQYVNGTLNAYNSGNFPHTIDKGTVTAEDGEDVIYYKGGILYSYNHSGSIGDIGRYDILGETFDDDYWSATLSGTNLASNPHQMILGGDDIVYITNGQYIAYLDNTTDNDKGLDFPTGSVVNSLTWNNNRVLAAVNSPNISTIKNSSAIYKWNGYSDSWEGAPIMINGRIGALYTKNGITYAWWEEFISGTSKLNFGIVVSGSLHPLRTFSGTLPLYYQVSEMGSYIIWLSGQRVYAYGPLDGETSTELFQLTSASYATTGGLGTPFTYLMVASTASTNYNLAAMTTSYNLDSYYYTLLFPTSNGGRLNVLDYLEINFEKLTSDQQLDLTVKDNKGTSLWTGSISYTTDGAATKKIFNPRCESENFRVEYSWANDYTHSGNQVEVRSMVARGITIGE